jgi:hypothetical protein
MIWNLKSLKSSLEKIGRGFSLIVRYDIFLGIGINGYKYTIYVFRNSWIIAL